LKATIKMKCDVNMTARVYPRVVQLKGASLGYAPALLASIRLGQKGLPRILFANAKAMKKKIL
jgi:hypothetical protein